MAWPYHFLDLSEEEKHSRRLALDQYASYAQLSALLPVAVVLLYRAAWALQSRKGAYAAIPNSPSLKAQRRGGLAAWRSRIRILKWWLGGDVLMFGGVWGQRDQWIVGALWLFWLLLLCILDTRQDYLHLTKRFGMIAASQYPLQYLLALKSLNPLAYAFRSSHEQVNRWHRVLGRITYALLCLHAAFYLNFFVQASLLQRLLVPIVAFGVTAFLGLTLLSTTALRRVRRYSYRLFFVTHLIVAIAMPPLLYFHAKPARGFMVEAIAVFFADLVSRKLDTVTSNATLESIPGTNLVKISASIPFKKVNRFREHPGSHIYLSVPAAARHSPNPASASYLLFEFLFSPFTVADVDEKSGDLTLVARHRAGPMTAALHRFAGAGLSKAGGPITLKDEAKIPLYIEGPYGVAKHFPNLSGSDFDRVLLVGGGVGATFIVPLYQSIVAENPGARAEMVWAVRGAGDATWAVGAEAQGILSDENVHIFLTGDVIDSADTSATTAPPKQKATTRGRTGRGASMVETINTIDDDPDGEVELNAMYRDRRRNKFTSQHNRKRPDLKRIVDDVFKHGQEERVAVVVCGPAEMASELREHVGDWVMKGRSVWWHNESFGF
ncbi:ferric reductase like transmembrane component-domain-containing protein [Podospora appendiculata]|uniref:Ferric reductase like transmembrane component-domain-containing protein n=1 Tax=Podospora appendiculata TaxID=314037 RepID=A0AAE0XCD8_9PEZI|nr:ferric reductase like transmembrane component-domain-containing protein [Podospora appendiculata]